MAGVEGYGCGVVEQARVRCACACAWWWWVGRGRGGAGCCCPVRLVVVGGSRSWRCGLLLPRAPGGGGWVGVVAVRRARRVLGVRLPAATVRLGCDELSDGLLPHRHDPLPCHGDCGSVVAAPQRPRPGHVGGRVRERRGCVVAPRLGPGPWRLRERGGVGAGGVYGFTSGGPGGWSTRGGLLASLPRRPGRGVCRRRRASAGGGTAGGPGRVRRPGRGCRTR